MRHAIYVLLQRLFSLRLLFPLRRKKIFFLGYYGSQYGCSPKYLSEHIVGLDAGWDVVWGFVAPEEHAVDGIRSVRYLSPRFFYELCTAAVLVTNYRMPRFYRKPADQLYVQTWHSSLRLKMIEGDAVETIPPHYVEMAKHDSRQIDVLLSGCRFSTDIFRRAFWYDGVIEATGTPRMDVLLREDSDLRQAVRAKLGLAPAARVVLYAPTFRKGNSLDCYDVDFEALVRTLSEAYGGEWKVLLRLHPHLREFSRELCKSDSVLDATAYDDIQELLCVAYCVISDYSSLIFDFAVTHRPCFLYVPDLEDYLATDRRLYFDIGSLPFPASRTNAELCAQIRAFDAAAYAARVEDFLALVGTYEDGHAAARVFGVITKRLQRV